MLASVSIAEPALVSRTDRTCVIDDPANAEIHTIINELAASGKGVIVISSELPELLGISDRIYTVLEGRVTDCPPAADATPEALMRSMTAIPTTNAQKAHA